MGAMQQAMQVDPHAAPRQGDWDDARHWARAEAEEVLDEFWGHGSLPVDPIAISKAMNVRAFRAQLGENISGMMIKEPGKPAEIFVDEDEGRLRSRFTIAHELGHFRDHVWGNDDAVVKRVDRRDGTSNIDEFKANEFAGSLLMPADRFIAGCVSGMTDHELANLFQVSQVAVRVRRQTLRSRRE